jgi:hypothetical protein
MQVLLKSDNYFKSLVEPLWLGWISHSTLKQAILKTIFARLLLLANLHLLTHARVTPLESLPARVKVRVHARVAPTTKQQQPLMMSLSNLSARRAPRYTYVKCQRHTGYASQAIKRGLEYKEANLLPKRGGLYRLYILFYHKRIYYSVQRVMPRHVFD